MIILVDAQDEGWPAITDALNDRTLVLEVDEVRSRQVLDLASSEGRQRLRAHLRVQAEWQDQTHASTSLVLHPVPWGHPSWPGNPSPMSNSKLRQSSSFGTCHTPQESCRGVPIGVVPERHETYGEVSLRALGTPHQTPWLSELPRMRAGFYSKIPRTI